MNKVWTIPVSALLLLPVIGRGDDATLSRYFITAQASHPVYYLNDEGSPYRFSLGAGYVFLDRLDGLFDFVYTRYDVNAVRDRNPDATVESGNSSSFGFDLRLRYTFAETQKLRWYVQGGAGAQTMITTPPFPADGSDQNLTLSLGTGVLIPFGKHFRLATTLQYFHISNSRARPKNSGYDEVQIVLSPEWRF